MPRKSDFKTFLKSAEPGRVFIYHREDWALRCESDFELAREASDAGTVFLTQIRTQDGWAHAAIKTSVAARKALDALSARIDSKGGLDFSHPHGLTPAQKFQQFIKNNARPASFPEPAYS